MVRYLVPLGIFIVLAGFFYAGLSLNPQAVPSPLIDKPAPSFDLSELHRPELRVTHDENLGRVWLLNVWASWCVSCRQEHPLFMRLARTGEVPIVGLNYKDQREDAIRWLEDFGDPYVVSGYDEQGRVGVDFGVYGVPETYVIDKQGVIRHKHTGPVTIEALQNEILPLVRKLKG